MTLLDLYSLLKSGQITDEEAASMLGMTLRYWKQRKTVWGARLPLLLSVLDDIKADKISREDAARALDVNVRSVNFLMSSWGVERPIKQYMVKRKAAEIKWEVRKKAAIDFIAGGDTIESAAEMAGVSERQMRRWVSDLLAKHFGMVFKDLKELTLTKRRRLAEEIETAERLELEKQAALRPVITGQKTIEEAAVERIIAKKARNRRV